MADISSAERKKLPGSAFAGPNRTYPIHDKAHADNAAARLEQQKGSMSPAAYARIKSKVKAAQRRFGEKPKGARAGSGKGLRMSITHADGTRTVVRHLASYSDADDRLILSLPLDKHSALADGDENKRVWVQIAKTGRWLGHRAGAFELTAQTFDTFIKNFRAEGERIQYDFEHASEMRPNEGSIPMVGVPAQGWIYDLKHDGQRLFALTEWKGLAREYISNDQYQGVSPSIHWKNKDRVTGKDIGPRLSSVALTNKPFLTGMRQPTAASMGAGAGECTFLTLEGHEAETAPTLLASGSCYSADEYMPSIRSALCMSELSTATQCSEALDALREHFDAAAGDPNGTHQGVQLARYLLPLRNLTNAPMGSSWDDVFDLIEELLASAMDDGEDDDNPEPVAASANRSEETETMPNENETLATLLSNTQAEVVTTKSLLTTAQAEAATVKSELATVKGEITTLSSQLTLRDTELAKLRSENATLLAANAEVKAKAVDDRVTLTIKAYGEKKGLTEASRKVLTHLCSTMPEDFDKEYPIVTPEQAHLLHNHTNDGRKGTGGGALRAGEQPDVTTLPVLNLAQLADKIAKEEGCSLQTAQLRAERIMENAKRAQSRAPAAH